MWQLILFALAIALMACQQQVESPHVSIVSSSPIVAMVNGTGIREADIDAEMNNIPESLLQYRQDPQARIQILKALIRRQAINHKAHQLGLNMNPIVQQRMQVAQRQILIEAAKSWQLANMAPIQSSEIQGYYTDHRDEFTVPTQVHARHILVSSESQAWQILKQLRRQRSGFEKLAASNSLDHNNKSRGGNLNWFPRGIMVKAFDDAVFALKVKGLSKPVETSFGWHIIELLGKRPAREQPLQEVRDEILSTLQHQRLQQWYQDIEAAADITIIKSEYQ